MNPATTPARIRIRHELLSAKRRKGLSWAEIAEAIDRSPVWTASALLGQQPLDEQLAATVASLLDVPDAKEALLEPPVRGSDAVDRTEPVVARFEEIVQVYGPAIADLIAEEFGDGIMSAIDFEMSLERREDPRGDRVVIVLDGKFLPYRVW